VEVTAELAAPNTLNSCRDAAKDPRLLTTKIEFTALDIGHLEAQLPDEIVVHKGGGGCGEVRGHQCGEWMSLAGEDVFTVSRPIGVARGEHVTAIVLFRRHRWFVGLLI